MTLAAVLCTLCYLVGIWQHSSGGAVITAAVSSVASCPPITINKTIHLDFKAHHTAEDLPLPPAAARVDHLPPCNAKLSEYTPCEDFTRSLKFDRKRLVYRERHCPEKEELLKCRIPAPHGYTVPLRWPESRDSVWYANVPHKELTVEKKKQNWVHYDGDRFRFPGGGTMFPRGADAYIDDIGKLINLRDGSVRTAIDTGCGVASWGAYLLSRDILTVSFAPRDTHEAQVQFALERGVPALIGILASKRLPYPSRAFDMAHCSRCLIPWGQYDGLYLIEVDRVLRPGGYWILSGPPINWENHWKGWERTAEDLRAEQTTIENVAKSLCWKKLKQKGDLAIWQKTTNHVHCKMNRRVFKKPSFCQARDPDTAWYTKMEDCLTPLPGVNNIKEIAGGELSKWPKRLNSVPPRISRQYLPSEALTSEFLPESSGLELDVTKQALEPFTLPRSVLPPEGTVVNLEDMPPLPPLPPMQWRMGKQNTSLFSQRESVGVSQDSLLPIQPSEPDEKAQFDMPAPQRGVLPPQNPFLPPTSEEGEKFQHVSEPLIGNMVHPAPYSLQLPTMVNDANLQHNFPDLGGTQFSNPFLSLPEVSDDRPGINHFASVGEKIQTGSNPFTGPSSECTTSTLDPESSHGSIIQPVQQVTPKTGIEPKVLQHSPKNSESEQEPLSTSATAPTMVEQPQHSLPTSEGEISWSYNNSAVMSDYEVGRSNGVPVTKLPRPRNPLIDAVAAHGQSKLRKVTERVRPQVEPDVDERDSLLQQIRTKSFNLKPAMVTRSSTVTRRSIQGPATNLRVAAILEKASAIRQACAGSDEDDDDDSWSDN